jgi:hypothetical protein
VILPTDEECVDVIQALADEPNLSDWEYEFVESNVDRLYFTTAQKEVIQKLREKYECE